eukprot:m.178539 g.178539  ORF g.178539 m.178539 type:complete len:394 (-) comp14567_c0_seq1:158-1339(-)
MNFLSTMMIGLIATATAASITTRRNVDDSGSGVDEDPRDSVPRDEFGCPPVRFLFTKEAGKLDSDTVGRRIGKATTVESLEACLTACNGEDNDCDFVEFRDTNTNMRCVMYGPHPDGEAFVVVPEDGPWSVYHRSSTSCVEPGCMCPEFTFEMPPPETTTTASPDLDVDSEDRVGDAGDICAMAVEDQFHKMPRTQMTNRGASTIRRAIVKNSEECLRVCVHLRADGDPEEGPFTACVAAEFSPKSKLCILHDTIAETASTQGKPTADNQKFHTYNRLTPFCTEEYAYGVCWVNNPLSEFNAPLENTKLVGDRVGGKAYTHEDCASRCLAQDAERCVAFSFVQRKQPWGSCFLYPAYDVANHRSKSGHTAYVRTDPSVCGDVPIDGPEDTYDV